MWHRNRKPNTSVGQVLCIHEQTRISTHFSLNGAYFVFLFCTEENWPDRARIRVPWLQQRGPVVNWKQFFFLLRFIIGTQINLLIYPFRGRFLIITKTCKNAGKCKEWNCHLFNHSEAAVVNIWVCYLPAFFQYYNGYYNSACLIDYQEKERNYTYVKYLKQLPDRVALNNVSSLFCIV